MAVFGDPQLYALVEAVIAGQDRTQGTIANTKLVLAYLRHGGDHDMCLRCLAHLPVMAFRKDEIEAACQPPYTHSKLACLERYETGEVEDLAFALRFSPELAPRIIRLLAKLAAEDEDTVIAALVGCLHTEHTQVPACAALMRLCTAEHAVNYHVVPHVPAIVQIAKHSVVAVRLLRHLTDRSVEAQEVVLDHGLPILVARGCQCLPSVHLMRDLAVRYPRAVVLAGGLTVIMLAGWAIPAAISALYQSVDTADTDHELLAVMHCRMHIPTGGNEAMRRIFAHQPPETRALYAAAYATSATTIAHCCPVHDTLPDFDVTHTGTLELRPADNQAPITVLLAPLARAAPFVDAHARHQPNTSLEVPLNADMLPVLVRALCYDEIPTELQCVHMLAELGHMWCARRLVQHCVEQLVKMRDFENLIRLAGEWREVKDHLPFYLLEHLPELAGTTYATELARVLFIDD